MPQANEYQVAGDHYKTASFQHWDYVIQSGLGYLEAQATRYLARWDKKGDPENDLKKARHYIEKLKESVLIVRDSRRDDVWLHLLTTKFVKANKLDQLTGDVVFIVAHWKSPEELDHALKLLATVEERFRMENSSDEWRREPAPVPATDSNKHATRAQPKLYALFGWPKSGVNATPDYYGTYTTVESAERARVLYSKNYDVTLHVISAQGSPNED